MGTLEFGQLHRAVDAGHLHRIGDAVRQHGHAVGNRELDDVGQVVLFLGVVVLQPRQPGLEQARRHRHDAAVDLADRQLTGAGILLLDDGPHRRVVATAVAHDAAISHGVVQLQSQQCQFVAAAQVDQLAQGFDLRQRHVAAEHHHDAVIGQHRHRLLHRVAGAELRLLAHTLQLQCSQHAAGRATCRLDLSRRRGR